MVPNSKPYKNRSQAAFTLFEVVIATMVVALVFGGIITAYTTATKRAEWSGYSLAAQALAIQQIEQARSAVWDPSDSSQKNEIMDLITNLNGSSSSNGSAFGYSWTNLDLPSNGGNFVRATNFVSLTLVSNLANNPAIKVQMLRVDTVWPFIKGIGAGAVTTYYTNTICTYIAPDNRDPNTL